MKVLIVNPPRRNMVTATVPQVVADPAGAGTFPCIGLLYIAAMAETVPEWRVRVIGAVTELLTHEALEEAMRGEFPDVVVVTAGFGVDHIISLARGRDAEAAS